MIAGNFEVREQVGPKGYFGRVSLQAEPEAPASGYEIAFDEKHAQRWQTGARFGIEYVLEHIPKKKLFPNGIRILVSCIDGHEVDTTNSIIAYVAANALMEALQDRVSLNKRPVLKTSEGLVEFPK
jgi:hypothetical protein